MATFDLGRVTPLYKGDYSASASYELNDVVLYNGNLYWHVQATATVGIAPTDTTVWKLAFSDEGVRAEIRGYTDDAQEYAESALASKSAAATSASNASASASQAALSAQSAQTAETGATASAQTASTKASEATASAQSAASDAQTATDKATLASQKAAAASESATLATAKASAAATSETNAAASAQTATAKASEAAASATSAQEYDESAQASAVNAQTAQTAAETAQTAAQTAQTGAETAAASVQSSAAQIATNTEDIAQLKSEFTVLTSDGAVPSAEQIISDKGVTDSVPYHHRKTGGEGADRLYDQIVGGSLAVNQLAKPFTSDYWSAENNVSVAFADSVATFTSQTANNGIKSNAQKQVAASHVYYMGFSFQSESASTITCFYGGNGGVRVSFTSATSMTGVYKITKADASASGSIIYLFPSSSGVNVEHKVKNVMLIDLTAMFGTTIADYVNGLETATAGAGVAWLKSHFPKIFDSGYIPYNTGTLEHVSGLIAHKMVGFNQFDKSTAVDNEKIRSSTGETSANNTWFHSDYIRVVPNTTYYTNADGTGHDYTVTLYDADKNYISEARSLVTAGTFNTGDATYIIVSSLKVRTSMDDLVVNLHWDGELDGEYEPYEEHSYPLDSTLTLRGMFKLDANNKLYADGDVYEYTGKVTRNTILRAYQSGDESLANAITDGTNTVVYSANASTEQATPYQHLQQCDPNGTEEYVSTGIVPVGHNSFYPENLRAKVEQLPWNFASLIAPTESTFTATRNYVTGELFIVNNVLYKATSNIANGGTITPNTNCTATTLAEIISALA